MKVSLTATIEVDGPRLLQHLLDEHGSEFPDTETGLLAAVREYLLGTLSSDLDYDDSICVLAGLSVKKEEDEG
jgi:hypothetical protein